MVVTGILGGRGRSKLNCRSSRLGYFLFTKPLQFWDYIVLLGIPANPLQKMSCPGGNDCNFGWGEHHNI